MDEIFELNKHEVLGDKLTTSPEFLTLKVLSKENYEIKRKIEISFILKNHKRRIYLKQPISIYKISEEKLFSFGTNKFRYKISRIGKYYKNF